MSVKHRQRGEAAVEQRRIPDIIGPQTLVTLTPRDCAHDAARLMTTHRISAILVVEGDCLVGICTERDIVTRVVAADRNPPTTTRRPPRWRR